MTDWHDFVTHRCMFNAGSLGIVKFGVDDLGKLPPHVIRVAQAKVHELVREAVRMEQAGNDEQSIHHEIEAQLWRLLREFKPAKSLTDTKSIQG